MGWISYNTNTFTLLEDHDIITIHFYVVGWSWFIFIHFFQYHNILYSAFKYIHLLNDYEKHVTSLHNDPNLLSILRSPHDHYSSSWSTWSRHSYLMPPSKYDHCEDHYISGDNHWWSHNMIITWYPNVSWITVIHIHSVIFSCEYQLTLCLTVDLFNLNMTLQKYA